MGSAIRFFKGSHGIEVPRSRFLPVKKTDDLLLIQSNLYDLQRDGTLVMSSKRKLPGTPLVKLDAEHFGTVKNFNERFASIPDILDLSHFTVSGDVTFGHNVSIKVCGPVQCLSACACCVRTDAWGCRAPLSLWRIRYVSSAIVEAHSCR